MVQVFGFHLTTLGHLLQPVVPDAFQIGFALLAVVVAHACQGVALHVALIFANLGHQVFDAEFVVEALQVFAFGAKTLEVDHALSVQIDVISHAGHVVIGLVVLVGIGHNPLAASLEVFQGIA